MKLTLPTVALALAAFTSAQYYNESAPFNLVLVSEDASVNGETLSACHEGAAIESLCLSGKASTSKPNPIPAVAFHFNTSDTSQTPNATLGEPGILTYYLPTTPPIPSAVELFIDPITSEALPLLFPGADRAQTMAFDDKDLLNIQGYVKYGANPPTYGDTVAYYRWYACTTYFQGYEYVALVWKLGPGKPENPTCVKVDVKRVFV